MMMAQRLYEAGYITYMRTDSTNLSADAIGMVRGFIEDEFGQKYLPGKANVYSSKEGAQEAHEAIRPSDVNLKPTQLSGMERDAERLYDLIWRQFVACQMTPAEYLSTSVSVTAGDFELRAKGRILKFDGYTRVLPQQSKPGEDDVLPEMKEGENLKLIKLDPSQHFTKPPARYSRSEPGQGTGEARYRPPLDLRGDHLHHPGARLRNHPQPPLLCGEDGRHRHRSAQRSFANLMDYGFTAGMEEHLDDVAQGERDWKHLLDEFYGDFKKKLEVAEVSEKGMRANQPTLTNIPCRECGRPMMIRTASTGVFLGCSGYSLPPKERCKATVNLIPGDEIAADDEGESESRVLRGKHRCPICSTAMDAYLLDETQAAYLRQQPRLSGLRDRGRPVPDQGLRRAEPGMRQVWQRDAVEDRPFRQVLRLHQSDLQEHPQAAEEWRGGAAEMDAIRMPELKCEKVDDIYVLRDGASGMFLAASQFPKNRETRAPLVSEIIPHKAELDPKYHYLCDAPQKDPDGRPAVIRFSRKTKEQYVQSEVDGKPTGWRAFYDGGKWKVEDKR